jgi:hypothetical protein
MRMLYVVAFALACCWLALSLHCLPQLVCLALPQALGYWSRTEGLPALTCPCPLY